MTGTEEEGRGLAVEVMMGVKGLLANGVVTGGGVVVGSTGGDGDDLYSRGC